MVAINFFRETSFLHSTERWIWIDVYKMARCCCPTEFYVPFFEEGNSSRTSLRLDHRRGGMPWTPSLQADQNATCAEEVGWTSSAQLLVLQFHFLHSQSLCDLINYFISQKYNLALLDLEQLKCKGFPYGGGRQAHRKSALCFHFRDIRMGKQSGELHLHGHYFTNLNISGVINMFKSS